jgi:hypothetical protein
MDQDPDAYAYFSDSQEHPLTWSPIDQDTAAKLLAEDGDTIGPAKRDDMKNRDWAYHGQRVGGERRIFHVYSRAAAEGLIRGLEREELQLDLMAEDRQRRKRRRSLLPPGFRSSSVVPNPEA